MPQRRQSEPVHFTKRVLGFLFLLVYGFVVVGCGKHGVPLPSGSEEIFADFRAEPRQGIAPTEVTFVDQSWTGDAAITAVDWEFGDGSRSNALNPVHTYKQPGIYQVLLRITVGEYESTSSKPVEITHGMIPKSEGQGGRLVLTPTENGARFVISHPDNPDAFLTLWGPESTTVPPLDIGGNELSDGPISWEKDGATGSLSFRIERPEGTFNARFVPHEKHVDCFYTVGIATSLMPKPRNSKIISCLSASGSMFDGRFEDIANRIHYFAGARWVAVGGEPEHGPRNIISFDGLTEVENLPGSSTQTLNSPRATESLLACVARNEKWIAAIATESKPCMLFCNTFPGYRCIHANSNIEFNGRDAATLRKTIYLFEGSLDDLSKMHNQRMAEWSTNP